MSNFDEHVLDEAEKRRRTLLVTDLVTLIERHEDDGEYGVSVDRVVEYAEELDRHGSQVDPTRVDDAIRERLEETDTQPNSGSWTGSTSLFELSNGHVSTFPERWHQELAGTNDVEAVLEFALGEVDDADEAFDAGGAGRGVPEDVVLQAATVLGGFEWRESKQEFERLRDEGVVTEDVDQHPNAMVRFADERAAADREADY